MIQHNELDAVKALLEIGMKLIPLLTEKKIESAIAGISEAKAVIAEKNKMLERADLVSKDIEKAEQLMAEALEAKKLNDETNVAISVAESSIKQREADLVKAQSKTEELNFKLAKQTDALEKQQQKLNEELKIIKVEKEIVSALRDEFNQKLDLIKAL